LGKEKLLGDLKEDGRISSETQKSIQWPEPSQGRINEVAG
jgi:hypothetical protein